MPGVPERFVIAAENILRIILCVICHGVPDDPVQTTGGGCFHMFCRACLAQWHHEEANCPMCKVGCDIAPVSPGYRQLWETVYAVCPHRNQGCLLELSLDEFHEHEQRCEYRHVGCPRSWCEWWGLTRDLDAHLDECVAPGMSHQEVQTVLDWTGHCSNCPRDE